MILSQGLRTPRLLAGLSSLFRTSQVTRLHGGLPLDTQSTAISFARLTIAQRDIEPVSSPAGRKRRIYHAEGRGRGSACHSLEHILYVPGQPSRKWLLSALKIFVSSNYFGTTTVMWPPLSRCAVPLLRTKCQLVQRSGFEPTYRRSQARHGRHVMLLLSTGSVGAGLAGDDVSRTLFKHPSDQWLQLSSPPGLRGAGCNASSRRQCTGFDSWTRWIRNIYANPFDRVLTPGSNKKGCSAPGRLLLPPLRRHNYWGFQTWSSPAAVVSRARNILR